MQKGQVFIFHSVFLATWSKLYAANCFIADIVDNAIYYEKAPADVTLNPMEIRTFQVNLVKGKSYKHLDKFSVFS